MAEWLTLRHAIWLRMRAHRLLKRAMRLRKKSEELNARADEIEREMRRCWLDPAIDRRSSDR